MRSRIATLLVVDMVGYSAMMSADQDAAIDAIRLLKHEKLEPVLTAHGGEILKRMGDGWIVAFPAIGAALDGAIEVQTNLSTHPTVKLRIGCHLGEIVEDEDDFYGTGVNIAQRIQTEAPPGGLMVSEDLFRQLSTEQAKLLSDAGTFSLKNISQPVRLYQWRPVRGARRGVNDVPSIAVRALDFAPIDAETEALAGDLRDQLIVRLSRRKGVSVFDAADKAPDAATYDLRGRLRLAAGRGRLTITLNLRADARPVWSKTYEAPTEDVFGFCDEVLELAEGDLRLQTNAFDGDRLADVPVEALSISELRARAANAFYKVTMESWAEGLALMERALQLNPDDGTALCMRIEAQMMLHGARYEALPEALGTAYADDLNTALTLMPQSDYAIWVRGNFRLAVQDDVAGARADLARGRQVNPAYLENHELEAQIALREGAFDDADAAFSRLIERSLEDPLRPYRLFMRGVGRLCGGDAEGAARDAAAAADLRPSEAGHLRLRALALREMGMAEAAQRCLEAAERLPARPNVSTKPPVLPPENRALLAALKPG